MAREGQPSPHRGALPAIPVSNSFEGNRSALGSRLAASIVQRWCGAPGEDPRLALQRASGERPEAAEALATFLDANSLEPLHHYLRNSGPVDTDALGKFDFAGLFIRS